MAHQQYKHDSQQIFIRFINEVIDSIYGSLASLFQPLSWYLLFNNAICNVKSSKLYCIFLPISLFYSSFSFVYQQPINLYESIIFFIHIRKLYSIYIQQLYKLHCFIVLAKKIYSFWYTKKISHPKYIFFDIYTQKIENIKHITNHILIPITKHHYAHSTTMQSTLSQ